MPKTNDSSPLAPPLVPETIWLGHGRHLGSSPEQDIRRNLIALKAAGVIDDFLDLDPADAASSAVGGVPDPFEDQDGAPTLAPSVRQVFEARWRVADEVTVRAQLSTYDVVERRRRGEAVTWVLAAEAEAPWDQEWPSPATMFWPDSDLVAWDHDMVPGPRLRATHRLPEDDKEMRRLLKDCARRSWNIHVVIHEAMTPAEQGRRPLASFLPPGLRHRVVEHRAAPEQAQIVNWALKDLHVNVPRGGAVVLPTLPADPAYEADRFTVRNLFLDSSEPTELLWRITAFAALPRTLTGEAERAVRFLRQRWHLLDREEELERARSLVGRYAEALDAMTASRDAYRQEAEHLRAELAAARSTDPAAPSPAVPPAPQDGAQHGTAGGALGQVLGRFKGMTKRPPWQ
ncbi:hypothetical protein [Streptomyces sp. NRRL S-1868]|uniref:hypothetical protein n=1 Tax=Streptomyces sp. NRRL S-1868 TaxID=1463892 RepID=UPI0004C6BE0A|nr:hypothetical protein [Streptomyces sp. NRRL S-1868]